MTVSPNRALKRCRWPVKNFALLNDGLDVTLDVTLGHNTLVANAVLASCILLALAGLAVLYRRGVRGYEAEEAQRQKERDAIRAREAKQKEALAVLAGQKNGLAAEIDTIQADLQAAQERAARNEADLFDEVETLEAKLQQNLKQQDRQQARVRELEDQLAQLAREREALSVQQGKLAGGLRKRMDTLYKNTSFSDRSLAGLAELPDSLQIKAEEVIHQLDAQADDVPVKRKLFAGQRQGDGFRNRVCAQGTPVFSSDQDAQGGHSGDRHQEYPGEGLTLSGSDLMDRQPTFPGGVSSKNNP